LSDAISASTSVSEDAFPQPNLTAPQFTVRAIATGMLLGALLSLCNIYTGLKIGWGFNMSITAALLSYAFWRSLEGLFKTRNWGMLENNINQTAASSGASISSAGLVAPIPALTMITGQQLGWGALALWVFAVSLVGIIVAVGLRRQMLLVDRLPFPHGIATAETIKEMYAVGAEAMARVRVLLTGAVVAGGWKAITELIKLGKLTLPGSLSTAPGGVLAGKGITKLSLKNLTFAFDPTFMMVALGALIGFRSAASMLLGAVIAWGFVGPWALEMGWATPGKVAPEAMWYRAMLKWLLWPGVAMMVTASLTSFAFSWRSVLAAVRPRSAAKTPESAGVGPTAPVRADEVPRKWFVRGLVVALLLAVFCQWQFYDIAIWIGTLGVLMTFLLAVVAARVSGETGLTPVGAMGKVTQLMFGVLAPGQAAANLMAANVTGGASSQAADLLHDMKTGLLIGASPRLQTLAQVFGVLAGSLAGSAAYLILIPDPSSMLLTPQWPAPAVAAWKAVAEIFAIGLDAMPPGAITAMIVGGAIGIVSGVAEKTLPKSIVRFLPSGSAVGLAFTIPGYYPISLFIGGLAAVIATRYARNWADRFLIVLAAGVVAGESLTGVALAIHKVLAG